MSRWAARAHWLLQRVVLAVPGLSQARLGADERRIYDLVCRRLLAAWHDYRSDRLSLHYGNEINFQLAAKIGKFGLALKYADYNAKAFATDTSKFWASVDWVF